MKIKTKIVTRRRTQGRLQEQMTRLYIGGEKEDVPKVIIIALDQ